MTDEEFYNLATIAALQSMIAKVPLLDSKTCTDKEVEDQRDAVAESASDYGAALVRARQERLNNEC